jgi:hypothetical protein
MEQQAAGFSGSVGFIGLFVVISFFLGLERSRIAKVHASSMRHMRIQEIR